MYRFELHRQSYPDSMADAEQSVTITRYTADGDEEVKDEDVKDEDEDGLASCLPDTVAQHRHARLQQERSMKRRRRVNT